VHLTLLAAVARNRIIGTTSGGIPWHLPAESAHFQSYCREKIVLVGRRTYQEMDGWFSDVSSTPLVLSRSLTDLSDGASVSSIDEAVTKMAVIYADHVELVVIGGGEVYELALSKAGRLVISDIDADFDGDVRFPEIDYGQWRLVSEVPHPQDTENAHTFVVRTWERPKANS